MAKSKTKPVPAMYQRWTWHNASARLLGSTLYHSRSEARAAQKKKGHRGSPIVLVTVVVAKAKGRTWQ